MKGGGELEVRRRASIKERERSNEENWKLEEMAARRKREARRRTESKEES